MSNPQDQPPAPLPSNATTTSPPSPLNTLASHFKCLHTPSHPLILTNVHDASTAHLVASNPSCLAVATASFSIAATQGIADDDMTLAQNLVGIRNVIAGVTNAEKWGVLPMTCDVQDGYEDVSQTVREVVELGCVGVNIEDVDCKKREIRGVEEAVARVEVAVKTAREMGVPDFVVNARTDVLGYGGNWDDVAERGKRFLEAGATCVFVWGVRKVELKSEDVKRLCEVLGGRVAIQGPGPTRFGIEEARELGVCRVSMGPWLFRRALEWFGEEADVLLRA